MQGYKEFIARIGDFFLVVGIFLFLLFFISDLAKKAEFEFLFLSLLSFGVAWALRRRRPKRPPAGRFAWYNKTRSSMKDRGHKSREK